MTKTFRPDQFMIAPYRVARVLMPQNGDNGAALRTRHGLPPQTRRAARSPAEHPKAPGRQHDRRTGRNVQIERQDQSTDRRQAGQNTDTRT